MISTVAVGTDGSETAEEAVKQAADIARRYEAKLVLLSAFQSSRGSPTDAGKDIELQWASNPSARLATLLERTEASLQHEGIECETRSDEGDPADVLVRLAEECGADLLVIGNKGMKRGVLGNVPKHGHAQGRLLGMVVTRWVSFRPAQVAQYSGGAYIVGPHRI